MVRVPLRIKQKGRKKNRGSGETGREDVGRERMIPDHIIRTPGSSVPGLISYLNKKSFVLMIVEHSFCYLILKKLCLTHTTSLNLEKRERS